MAWKNAAYRKQFLEYLRGQFQIQEVVLSFDKY